MKNIIDIVKEMNKAQLQQAVEKAKEFAATKKGQELVQKLVKGENIEGIANSDKDNLMQELKKHPDIIKQISEIIGKE